MIDTANLTLSTSELALATNKDIILTKRIIIEKNFNLFNEMAKSITNIFANNLQEFEKLTSAIPKIYKGENYNLFPYVMMDYPSTFENENLFVVRTMFFWRTFMSITLHLSGEFKEKFEKNILNSKEDDLYICVVEAQWQHHFEYDNYKRKLDITKEDIDKIKQRKFIKVALKYELHHWNMMQQILPEGYKKINELLAIKNT